MAMIDFTNINYLKNGNSKQSKAYEVLTSKEMLSKITEFNPILVGTIPINIDIENSDLDIICYWENKQKFIKKLNTAFGNESDFEIQQTLIDNKETIIANFKTQDFEIEIFGQNIPVNQQNGYRHMIIEYEILQTKGENFRQEIIKLKQQGYKTEPAFGLLLGLKGNPYLELLEYKTIS
ncbi:diadenosine tetraphosphate hydrolase [Flavobacterium hydatis]|uniref:Diadenosine tetraphosphate hydrolase n=2 Tax=Flavobacterium hydatis TaxID=991 RepID=A0ABX4CAL5_FLAHY|nr:diadenosine tetraphosphate hydrolase [Flavobacterium hydatis]